MRGLCLGNEDNVYGADVAVTEEYVDIIRETFSENKGITSPQTVGYRMKRNPRVGSFDANGGYTMALAPENCGMTLLGFFGYQSDTYSLIGAGEGQHIFGPASQPSYLTAGIVNDVSASMRTYPGVAIKTLKTDVKPGEFVPMEVDCFCQTINIDADASPSPSALPPFMAEDGSIELDDVADTDIKALSLTLTNDWEEGDYRIGSMVRKYAKWKGLSASGSIERYFESKTELQNFLGTGTPVAPAQNVYSRKLELILQQQELISGVTNYYLDFVLSSIAFDTNKVNLQEQDEQIQVLEFNEAYRTSGGSTISCTLKNGVTTDYDA